MTSRRRPLVISISLNALEHLPGTPDIMLPKYRTAIFVHGCFWHRHDGCSLASMPKTRAYFWGAKFEQNIRRDRRNIDALGDAGWEVLTVWECEARRGAELHARLAATFP